MKDDVVILFDCYGLFASDPYMHFFMNHFGDRYREVKDHYCVPGDRGEISFVDFLQSVEDDYGIPRDDVLHEAMSYFEIYEPMFDLAHRCKKRHRTYLVSNCMKGMIEDTFGDIPLFDCFDRAFLSCEIGLVKPDVSIFRYVLKELGFPKNVIFFDDNDRNVQGAKEAGIDAILFESVEQAEEELRKRGLL